MGNLLVVEDDTAVRTVVADAAATLGHRVQTAGNAREALEVFERETFDCVITDIAMPEMDGLTLLRRIKRRRPGTGVLVVTGNSTVESIAAAVNSGADAYVTKPFRIAELDEQLHRILGHATGQTTVAEVTERTRTEVRKIQIAASVAGLLSLLALLALALS